MGRTVTANQKLPALRQDLRLLKGAANGNGEQQWLLHDPLQHRFFAIGRNAYVLMALWEQASTASNLRDLAWQVHGETIETRDIEAFVSFLFNNRLTLTPPGEEWRHLAAAANGSRRTLLMRLVHNYLFFRIPLVYPSAMLLRTLPAVRWLGTAKMIGSIATAGALGLYLVSREWDQFAAQASTLVTWRGAITLAAVLFLVKIIHELAHAFVATSYGCRVPTIGIAVMMGAPMLYADVTDAWRLTDRRQRLRIDAAGIAAEIALACIATLFWALLADGTLKWVMLILATVSWTMSIFINLNPLMRFDGYHILADVCGIDNLQTRAFAVGRWRMREILFRPGFPPPEDLPRNTLRWLALYAWLVWAYRVVLFTGIAVAVYYTFFKALGVILFTIEIAYFIAGPIMTELKQWWRMRAILFRTRRAVTSASVAAIVLALSVVPWSRNVHLPAVLEAERVIALFAPEAATVAQVHATPGQSVERGMPLLTLTSHALIHDIRVTRLRLDQVAFRLDRRTADDIDREDTRVLLQEQSMLKERLAGLAAQQHDLTIKAPFAGRIAELDPVHPGQTVSARETLALVRSRDGWRVRGLVPESDIWRIRIGSEARFIADAGIGVQVQAQIVSIGAAPVSAIDPIELAAVHGGTVPAEIDNRGRAVSTQSHYAVDAEVSEILAPGIAHQSRRGVLIVDGARESFLARFWRHALKIAVRESGL